MKRVDPSNFANLTNAPLQKDDFGDWCQLDEEERWVGMMRWVAPNFIAEYYEGGFEPYYYRSFTNVCRFEGVFNGDGTFTGEVVYHGTNQT
eukprot:CAMPEP_0168620374 /NCGR_PEP_ID=MMETSP0449_2-20121227/7102_1 /TAXON_ID=1082188 /ORGANISM="Strombidium rassoulzadegani, Strain ras09" /LENGTH=90 /DNA_ID=CAMNT_0008661373 /DNA_START=136 /DNA_END=404 /DNA_ORIENTATION=-